MRIGPYILFEKREKIMDIKGNWVGYNPNGAPIVDQDSIISLSAVWSCVRVLSEGVSGLHCG